MSACRAGACHPEVVSVAAEGSGWGRPRPAWVADLNGSALGVGGPAALVSLGAASFTDDDGDLVGAVDGPAAEALALVLDGLDTTAALTVVGRLLARTEMLTALRARRAVTAAHARDPSLATAPVAAPLFITGTGRSGTSILHELLAQDPANRPLLTYEALHPRPWGADVAGAVTASGHQMGIWDHIAPAYRTMHENGATIPQECTYLFAQAFVGDAWTGQYHLPALARWQAEHGLADGYRWHRQVLQVLQRPGADTRWALKAPMHLPALPALFAEYPDAHVVVTHRDPHRVLGSLVSLMATLRGMRSDEVDVARLARSVVRGMALVLDAVDEARAAGTLPDDRIIDLRYADLVADPVGTVATLYDRVGRTLEPAAADAMRAYLAVRPQGRHGAHRYTSVELLIDDAEVDERYGSYVARHAIPREDR
jgi:hypothetical protein